LKAARHPTYWVLVAAFIGGRGGYTLFMAHGVVHLQDLGRTDTIAAWAVRVSTVSGLVGKLILAAFGDHIDPRNIYALCFYFLAGWCFAGASLTAERCDE
jgi:hypothetical protein